jgi:hypothetical protein
VSGRRIAILCTASVIALAAGLCSSAAAETPQHFRFTLDPESITHAPCGATEVVTTTIWGAEHFDQDGNSSRIQLHFDFDGVITAVDGRTFRNDARQNAIFTPSGINSLNGQGFLFTIPGEGVAYQDVGHLVFDDTRPPELSTIKQSAKALGFGVAADAFSQAICAALIR